MIKKKADTMIQTFALVTSVITSIGLAIKAIAELIDFLMDSED